jgi:hypothetical protein
MKAVSAFLAMALVLILCGIALSSEQCGAQKAGSQCSSSSCPCCPGSCGGACNMVRLGCPCRIQCGQKVNNVFLILNKGTVSGKISGNCIAIGSYLTIADSAEVKGDLIALFSLLEKRAEPQVAGQVVSMGIIDISGFPPFLRYTMTLWEPLLALAILIAAWSPVRALTDRTVKKPGRVVLLGLAGLLLFVPASLLRGVPLLVALSFLALLSTAGFAMGYASLACLIGERIPPSVLSSLRVRALLALVGIAALAAILAVVPFAGALASETMKMSLRTLGLGLLLSALFSPPEKQSPPVC